MKVIIIVLLAFILSCFLAPIMERLFDKATYAFGKWLSKQFPSSGIIQPSDENAKQRYSRVYIPKPFKDMVNYIFRPIPRGNITMKNSKTIKNSEKSNEYPLSKQ